MSFSGDVFVGSLLDLDALGSSDTEGPTYIIHSVPIVSVYVCVLPACCSCFSSWSIIEVTIVERCIKMNFGCLP